MADMSVHVGARMEVDGSMVAEPRADGAEMSGYSGQGQGSWATRWFNDG